jgi:hypothetical protein
MPTGPPVHQTLWLLLVQLDGIFQDRPVWPAAQSAATKLLAMMELIQLDAKLDLMLMETSALFAVQPISKRSTAPHQLSILLALQMPISQAIFALLAQLLIVPGLRARTLLMPLHAPSILTTSAVLNAFSVVQ